MKKIITICALLFTAMLFTGCFLNPVAGKEYAANILGFEYGYSFAKEGTYKEFSSLGTISTGTYSYDLKTKQLVVTDGDGEKTEFLYDSAADQIIEKSDLLNVTYSVKKAE